MQRVKVIQTEYVTYSLLRVGNNVWAGAEKNIVIWDTTRLETVKTLSNRHSDPITCLLIVWGRIIWSASMDKTICIWS